MEITTPRLILKSITPAVIHEQYNTRSKDEIMRFFGFDEQGYEHHREMHEKGMETHRFSVFYFLLIDKETNSPIGECGFHTWNKLHARAELFYNMRNESFRQKGLMTEALGVVLDHGFNELELHRVEALVASWNTPSLQLLGRYGFTFEGTMREDYIVDGKHENSDCYSLLKWEWEDK